MSTTLRRLTRFLWLLARGPLRLLAGVAGGCAILGLLFLLGHASGVTSGHLAAGMAYLVIGLSLLAALLVVAWGAWALWGWVKAAWQEAKSS